MIALALLLLISIAIAILFNWDDRRREKKAHYHRKNVKEYLNKKDNIKF